MPICLSLLTPCGTLAQAQGRLGVAPYLPPLTLVERYAPLARHLEATQKRAFGVVTAPDIRSFLQRALAGEYEFVVSGPGPGRYLERERQCRVLAVSEQPVQAVLFVPAASPLRSLQDLAGREIAAPERFTGIAQLGEAMLRQAGLKNGQDYRFRPAGSLANVVELVAVGDAPAGLTNASTWEQLAPRRRQTLHELARSEALPGILFLHCPAADGPSYSPSLLLEFAASPSGRDFIDALGLIGLRPPRAEELARMDALLPAIRLELEGR